LSANLADQGEGGVEEFLLEVAVVIGSLSGHKEIEA
jgi:hypothetical protein